jgi:hypothetical protein
MKRKEIGRGMGIGMGEGGQTANRFVTRPTDICPATYEGSRQLHTEATLFGRSHENSAFTTALYLVNNKSIPQIINIKTCFHFQIKRNDDIP